MSEELPAFGRPFCKLFAGPLGTLRSGRDAISVRPIIRAFVRLRLPRRECPVRAMDVSFPEFVIPMGPYDQKATKGVAGGE